MIRANFTLSRTKPFWSLTTLQRSEVQAGTGCDAFQIWDFPDQASRWQAQLG
jgi:hypothetical protein